MKPEIIQGGLAVDERGVVRFVNDFDFASVKRFYVLENHQVGYIRAWHGHATEEKYICVMSGCAVIGVAQMGQTTAQRYILSGDKPAVLHVPAGYANGSMALVEGTQIIHFSTCTLDESGDDDIRFGIDSFDNIWELIPR